MVAVLYDNLVRFDVDVQLQPGLVTRWEMDSRGRRYTFHFRSGATFHDGKPIGAMQEILQSEFIRTARAKGRAGSILSETIFFDKRDPPAVQATSFSSEWSS
jgi:MarR-like DNA-binding transcriptional regulator SgrR of sgrS sRNA